MGNLFYSCKYSNEIICPLFLNDNSKHNMKRCHFSQLLCNTLCSTALVTDHDKPAVKSIVILRIPKYNVLTYKNIPINVTKEYHETFFESKNPKIWP